MKISARLSDEDYNTKLTPVIVRLFSNPDRAIRVCLLDHLPQMIEHLPQKIVNDKIFPQMVRTLTYRCKDHTYHFGTGHRLCGRSAVGAGTDYQSSADRHYQTFGSHHQWRTFETSCKDFER